MIRDFKLFAILNVSDISLGNKGDKEYSCKSVTSCFHKLETSRCGGTAN